MGSFEDFNLSVGLELWDYFKPKRLNACFFELPKK